MKKPTRLVRKPKPVQKSNSKFAWNLNDLKFIKKGKKIHEESKFAWVLSDLIGFDERLDESEISNQAHAMGLKFAGWGKWKNSAGVVTHKSVGNTLVPIGTKIPKTPTDPSIKSISVGGVPISGPKPVQKPPALSPVPTFDKPTGSVSDLDSDSWETFAYNASVKTNEARAYYDQKFLKDPAFNKFAADLPKSESSGIYYYSGSGHGDINRWLRKGSGIHHDDPTYVKEKIASMDKAFDKAPRTSHPIMVFRGIEGGDFVKDLINVIKTKMVAGAEFEDPGFVSTSAIRSKAEGFGNSLVFSIRIPSGAKGVIPLDISSHSLTQHSSEFEVLLRRGSRFKVRKVITEESPSSYSHDKVSTKVRVILDFVGAPGHATPAKPTAPTGADVAFAAAEKPDWPQTPSGIKMPPFWGSKQVQDKANIGKHPPPGAKAAGEIFTDPETGTDVHYDYEGNLIADNGNIIHYAHELTKPSQISAPADPAADINGPVTMEPSQGSSSWADQLQFVKPLGGTQGSKVYKSQKSGKLYAIKGEDYSGDPKWNQSRVVSEMVADRLYQRFGIFTPKARVIDLKGKKVLATNYMQNLEKINVKDPEQKKKVADGFAVDLLMGNRDVVGLEMDNIMWDPVNQEPYRLDNGAAFQFRAQGSEKPFDVETMWKEFKGLRNHDTNLASAMFFGDLSDKDIAEQVIKRIKPVDDTTIEAMVQDQPMPMKEKNKIIQGLIQRKAALVKWADEYVKTAAPMQEYFDQFRV